MLRSASTKSVDFSTLSTSGSDAAGGMKHKPSGSFDGSWSGKHHGHHPRHPKGSFDGSMMAGSFDGSWGRHFGGRRHHGPGKPPGSFDGSFDGKFAGHGKPPGSFDGSFDGNFVGHGKKGKKGKKGETEGSADGLESTTVPSDDDGVSSRGTSITYQATFRRVRMESITPSKLARSLRRCISSSGIGRMWKFRGLANRREVDTMGPHEVELGRSTQALQCDEGNER
ncbi:hypothetical protein BBJ29_004153 [Phytophthora kernoviae]|uniref:Uncharacterized protein n=1 Tax=Phytophthora kernoviae TaxID=325452 RepID=A0A3F2RMJ8_9STRA|nr:hypothetical protein BBJ29_004153 [Phytophthora kernoviae]RLN60567.1 hypothetical protein BBP00_00005904 [Phytophthora kernoviae]